MAASRKISREANEEDLNQMKNIFGASSVKQDEQNTQVSQTLQAEKSSESTKQIETVAESDSQIITEEHKPTSDTTVGIRMTTAKKREMKAYFIQHGTTMSQGVIDAFSLLKTLENEGLVSYKDGLLQRN